MLAQALRKAWHALRRIELERRICAHQALAHAVLVEALETGHAPRGAGRAALFRSEECEQAGFVRREQITAEECLQLLQIRAIGGDRVLREPVLQPQGVAERV